MTECVCPGEEGEYLVGLLSAGGEPGGGRRILAEIAGACLRGREGPCRPDDECLDGCRSDFLVFSCVVSE